jgi:hypothetical protein
MKKFFSFLLILSVLLSLVVLPAGAVENTPDQVKKMQRAVVETALAYYWKGAAVEYDYATMTIRDRKNLGESKLHTGDAPEMASLDNIRCYHCADWIRSVYLNVMNYAVCPERHAGVMQMNIYKSAKIRISSSSLAATVSRIRRSLNVWPESISSPVISTVPATTPITTTVIP